MSFVTTASASRSASARHSAATRAVLPDPTGPPTPIRSARRAPPVTAAAGAWSGTGASWPWLCSSSCSWACAWPCSPAVRSLGAWSAGKEGHLPVVVALGEDVEQGSGGGRQQRQPVGVGGGQAGGLRGEAVQGRRERGERRSRLDRVEADQAHRGGRQPGHLAVQASQRRVRRVETRRGGDGSEGDR